MANRERDVILAIASNSPQQKVEGRTLLQKLAYFLNELVSLDIPFAPGYYGPYSEVIAKATDSLVALGFLQETETPYPPGPSSVFEPRKYTYKLTSQGEEVYKSVREKDTKFFETLENEISRILKEGEADYTFLSIAAKTAHILKSQRQDSISKPEKMSKDEIMAEAHKLQWQLSDESIEKAAEFLIDLDLVKKVPPDKS